MLYVYMTTNTINNMKYIGQHRGQLNDNYLGSGVYILRAIKKYGKQTFIKEILEICQTQRELNEAEQKWIKHFNAVKDPMFYNIASGGGQGGNPCAGLSEEQQKIRREKLSNAMKGENNPFYGKGFHGEEHPMYGRHHSDQAKEKMRLAKLGKSLSQEHKQKISLNNPQKKKVYMYDSQWNLLNIFNSLRETNIFLNLSPNSTYRLRQAINNKVLYHNYYFLDEAVSTSSESGAQDCY